MLKKSTIIYYFEFYLATLFAYANGSWLMFEANKTVILAVQLLSILFYLYLIVSENGKIRPPNIFIMFLALMPFFSKIFNLNVNASFVNTFSVSTIYLALGFLSKENLYILLDKYARVIYFLCLVTLILGPLTLVNYSILNVFPVHHNSFDIDGLGYYNLIIFTERVSQDFRTQSIYWEPGVWSFNLMFAFYWLIILKEEYKKTFYFIGGVLLASSTTGFILLLILLGYLFTKKIDVAFKMRLVKFIAALVLLLVVAVFYVESKSSIDLGDFIYSQTIGKLTGNSDVTAASLEERSESTHKAFQIALSNPLFGVGKLEAGDALFVTSSFAEIAYQLGLLYLIVYVLIFRIAFRKLGFITSLMFIFILLNGEALGYFTLCSVILIYGAKHIVQYNRSSDNPSIPINAI